MKNNLENSIKESVKGYELPYDPSAWEAMSKKLDHVMPVSPKSNLKWYLGGAATVAVIITTIALWPADKSTSIDNAKTAQNELSSVNNTVNTENSSTTTSNNKSDKTNTVSKDASINTIEVATDVNPVKQILNEVNIISPLKVNNSNQSTNPTVNPISYTGISPMSSKKIEIADMNNICLGESISIVNKNDVNLTIIDPNGTKTIIKSNKTTSITPELEGKYTIGSSENGQLTSKSFNVVPLPKIDFSIDDQNSYENGLPSINVSATTSGYSYTWDLENQKGSVYGKDISVHYFNKGSYKVSLTIQGANGCKATETKTIHIADDYNLLAVNAFDPNANDMRLNSFMPFALTQRNVDFNMIIIDPKDGAVIFETNDATNHWTGVDKRNGQMVPANKAYIWKVVIQNPVKGEKSEYKSTIIRL
jgi:hypothetical protein